MKQLQKIITEPIHGENKLLEPLVNTIAFLAIYILLIYYFKPNLIFSLTTTSGGDMGAHINWGYYLKNYFLPKGRIIGWAPDWYAGFPLFQFYFPLPYLLIVLLSYLIPYQIAFKLITILGIFLLPLATFFCFKLLKFEFPMPILAASFTLPFLFLESYSIYGGNILSTLAGEFGYSISFALTILFLGSIYRGLQEKKYILANAVLLALIVLNHLITTITIVLAMIFFLLRRKHFKPYRYLFSVFALAFCLTAFWSLPFLVKLPYSTHMKWGQLRELGILFPRQLSVFFALAGLGIIFAVTKRNEKMLFFLWALAMPVFLFVLLPDGRLWNGRFIPPFYFLSMVWAAYGVFEIRQVFSFTAYRILRLPQRLSDYLLVLLALSLVLIFILSSSVTVPAWIEWNYSGYEKKPAWNTFRAITQYMKNLPQGRIMWEHSPKINKFGTQLAFMTFPYFSNQPTMESILLESAFTAPFHFINQAELSEKPSHAVQGVKYPPFNLADGITHLRLFNIKYYIAVSPKATKAADAHPDLRLLKRIDEFSIYKLKNIEGYVVVPENEPLIVKTSDWLKVAIKWYKNKRMLDTPLVLVRNGDEDVLNWPKVPPTLEKFPRIPLNAKAKISETIRKDEIVFRTTAIGKPHWIKMSYFPNWKVQGADGPYLASPSFMMVVPKQSKVRLYYGQTLIDWVGIVLSLLSLMLVGVLGFRLHPLQRTRG